MVPCTFAERLYADDDVYGYAVYSGAFWRRVPKADAVGERAVSSYAVSGAVGDLLCVVGGAFGGVAGSGGDHICVWDRDDVHELQECFDGPYPFFRVNHQSRMATVLWMAGLTGMITVIALVIRWCKFGF